MSRRALQLLWGLPAPPLCGEALRRAQLPLGQSGAAELCPALARGFFGLHAVRRFSTPAPASWGRHGPKGGPVSFKTLVLAMMAGAGVITAVKTYKDATLQQVLKRNDETVGKAAVGGPFSLIDQDGKPFSDRDLQGEFTLLYFGFTHCPDICPEELEKMSEAVDIVERMAGRRVRPLFISVDPQRDNPKKVKAYVREFHPRMVGLTGDEEAIRQVSKSYRVFFHKTKEEADDYLVDHSIIHYLLDPQGDFVTFYGKNLNAQQLAESIVEHLDKWAEGHKDYTVKAGDRTKTAPTIPATPGAAVVVAR